MWDHTTLDSVSLAGAELSYARFDHARGGVLDLRRANLSHASFHNARFVDTDWRDARRAGLRGTSAARLAAEARALSLEMH